MVITDINQYYYLALVSYNHTNAVIALPSPIYVNHHQQQTYLV